MADQLDDLTNDQLRLRLLEYGMANMPVTSTTRKVLVKKLRNAIEAASGAGDKPTKNSRRETIAVARFSSGDESEADPPAASTVTASAQRTRTKAPSVEKSSSRRATIGVPSAAAAAKPAAVVAAPPPPASPPQQKPKPVSTRRSSGRTTPQPPSDAPAPVSRAPAVVTLQEYSDDDEIEFVSVQQPPVAVAKSAAASPGRQQRRSPSMGKSETVVTSFKPPAVVPEVVSDETESDMELGEPELRRTSTQINSKPIVAGATKQYFSSSRSSTTVKTTSYLPATAGGSGDSLASTSARRATINAAVAGQPVTPPRSAIADDLLDNEAHTPYLSDFTRRLSRLRAEPLGGGNGGLQSPADRRATIGGGQRRVSQFEEMAAPPADVTVGGAAASSSTYAYRTSMRVHGRPAVTHSLQQQQLAAAAANKQSAVHGALCAVSASLCSFEQRWRVQIWSVVALLVAVFVFTMVFA